MSPSGQHPTPDQAANSQVQPMSQLELDRLRRIEENKRRLDELGVLKAAAALRSLGPLQAAKKPVAPRRQKKPRESVAVRVSARLQNRPAVSYKEHMPEEVVRVSRKPSCRALSSNSFVLDYGMPLLAGYSGSLEDWHEAPAGWKGALGTATEAGAAAALEAAEELAKSLEEQGKKAHIKVMERSVVSGGFWCSVPRWLLSEYGNRLRWVVLLSTEQEEVDPEELRHSVEGSSTLWCAKLHPPKAEPRPTGPGLSGGWRGAAIDNMLAPFDAVVMEVLDNADLTPEQQAAALAGIAAAESTDKKEVFRIAAGAKNSLTSAADAAKKASPADAAAPGGAEGAGGPKEGKKSAGHQVPLYRLALKMHVFRAKDFDPEDQKQQQKQEEQKEEAEGTAAADDAPAAAAGKPGDSYEQQQQDKPVCAAGKKRSRDAEAAEAAQEDAQQQQQRSRKKKPQAASTTAAAADGSAAAAEGAIYKAAGKSKRRSKGSKAPRMVRQPANPQEWVPPPTEDEMERDAAGGPFTVNYIMGHKVDCDSGRDMFLVSWEGFGPYWDDWVEVDALDALPHTYDWWGGASKVPRKFRPKA